MEDKRMQKIKNIIKKFNFYWVLCNWFYIISKLCEISKRMIYLKESFHSKIIKIYIKFINLNKKNILLKNIKMYI